MDTFKAVALAILLALIGEPARAESFPAGDVFRPLVADSAEPRFFISVLSVDRSNDKLTVGSIGGGVNFGLYRWPGERADEGWQVGIFGSITSQADLGSSSDDLINADYRVGLPALLQARRFLRARADLSPQLSPRRRSDPQRPAPFGQYFRHNVSYYGAGVQFDL